MSISAINEGLQLISNIGHVWDERDKQLIENIIGGAALPQNIRYRQIATALNVRLHTAVDQKVKDTFNFYIFKLMILDVKQTQDPLSRLWVGQTTLDIALKSAPKTDQERKENEVVISRALSYFMLEDPNHREILKNKYCDIYQVCSVVSEYYFKNNDRNSAIEWLKKAVNLNDTAIGKFNCGKLLISFGEKTLGREYIQQAANGGLNEAAEWLKKEAADSSKDTSENMETDDEDVQIIDAPRESTRTTNRKRKTPEKETRNPRPVQQTRKEPPTPTSARQSLSFVSATPPPKQQEGIFYKRSMEVVRNNIETYNKNYLPTIAERCNLVELFLNVLIFKEENKDLISSIKLFNVWLINNLAVVKKNPGILKDCPESEKIAYAYNKIFIREGQRPINVNFLYERKAVDRVAKYLNLTFTKEEIDFLMKVFMEGIEGTPEGIKILNKYNKIFKPEEEMRAVPPIQPPSLQLHFDDDSKEFIYTQEWGCKVAWAHKSQEEKYRYAEEAMHWTNEILQKCRNPYSMNEMSNVHLRLGNDLMGYQWAIRAASYDIVEGLEMLSLFALRKTRELPLADTPLRSILEKYIKCKFHY